VSSGQDAVDWRAENTSDLILIDVHHPELDTLELVRQLRMDATIPILLLMPDSNETLALEAYRAGVDEYIAKPISPALFLAKMRVWLHRGWTVPANILDNYQVGHFQLEPARRRLLLRDGAEVKLSNLEFRVIHLLMTHPRQVIEAPVIIDRVWGYAGGDVSGLLKNVIYRLRRKIEPDPAHPRYIQSVTGEGYTFFPE
jgi:DNA-binding response OmpR family regulator